MKHLQRNMAFLVLAIAAGLGVQWAMNQSGPQTTAVVSVAQASYPLAPDFTYQTLTGQNGQLSGLRGKTVLLNFWASWCAPCREEFPQFIALAKQRADVVILAVSVDHDTSAMQRFLDEHVSDAKTLPNIIIAHDPKKEIAQDLYQTIRFPETSLIDRQGQLRRKYVGLEVKWDSAGFMATLPAD